MATTFRSKKNHPLGVGTLNTAIDDNDLSIVIDAGQGASFPASNFTISIDEEIILIDSRSTDTLTVNASGRGYDSSTASAHAAGVAIANYQIVKDFTDCETAINGIENGTTTLAKVISSGTAANSHTVTDAGTNTVVSLLELYHLSSGTPASGLGTKMILGAEDSAGTATAAMELHGYLSVVTNGGEYGEALLKVMYNGSLKTVAKFTGLSTGSVIFYDTPLVLDTNTAGTGACWFIMGPAGTNRHWGRMFTGTNQTTGKRWDMYANDTAESGSNAGTDFRLGAYDDSGSWIDDPIQIPRAAGGAFTTPRPLKVAEDTDTTIILGRARFDSRVSDVAYFSHYDQTATTAYALKQNSSGNTVVNCIGIGTLANSGTNSIQWSNGRLVGGPALGTLNVRFAGTLSTNITTVGNVGTGVDDLMSYTVPAAQLSTDKDTLNFELVFKTAANANNKQIKVLYGATTLYDSGVVAANDDQLVVRGRIIRTGATTQIAHITAIGNAGGAFTDTVTLTTPAETLSGTVALKSTGEATSDNDIQQIYQTIIWEPAA